MKLGPNEPCHCGSGKKYKKCCWSQERDKQAEAAQENRDAAAADSAAPAADTPQAKPPVPKHHSKKGMARSSAPRRRAI